MDWGMSLIGSQADYVARGDEYADDRGLGQANLTGRGGDEFLDLILDGTGWYALAVWKTGGAEVTREGTYTLEIRQVGVADTPVAETQLLVSSTGASNDGADDDVEDIVDADLTVSEKLWTSESLILSVHPLGKSSPSNWDA